MNHYEILDLNQACHQSEIKKAYRKQVKQHHPDINSDPGSVDRMIRINEAYEVLSDVTTRNLYDLYLKGVPVKTIIQETTPEQKYRAEYLRKKAQRKREQMEYEVRVKQKFYYYYRFVNILLFALGVLLSIDYYYQPYEKKVKLEFVGKGRFDTNIITAHGTRMQVNKDFYYEYQNRKTDEVLITYSSLLRRAARIKVEGNFEDHIIRRTLYSFRNVFSILILIFSASIVKHKRYSDFRLSAGLVALISALYILLYIGLKS